MQLTILFDTKNNNYYLFDRKKTKLDENVCQKDVDYLWTKITYTGMITKEQVYKFYQIADIGVLPSFTEQCSYVAIEMIENSVTGYKVALQETEDDVLLSERMLAEKMIDLITDSDILQF